MKFKTTDNRLTKRRTKHIELLVSIVLLLATNLTHTQTTPKEKQSEWKGHIGMNKGFNSMGGYSLSFGTGAIKKGYILELSCGVDSEMGNRTSGSGIFELSIPYNDKFYHVEFLYGRLYRIKRFLGSLKIGGNSFLYIDKGERFGQIDLKKGFGLVVRPAAGFLLGEKVLLGIELNYYLNDVIQVINVGSQCKIVF